MPPAQLWGEEVPLFDRAAPRDRMQRVSVIRAVGVAFAGTGSAQQRAEVRAWLLRLLQDPQEKIRRYATAALPKIGAGTGAEREMVSLLKNTTLDREKKSLGRALGKIGGAATLAAALPSLPAPVEQKVKARVLREAQSSTIRLNQGVEKFGSLRIHLRCRRGLEFIVRDEVQEFIAQQPRFRLLETRSGCVALSPLAPFTLNDLFQLRCFATIGLVLDLIKKPDPAQMAATLTSPRARYLLTTLTEGPIRYRLEFTNRGPQRGAVNEVASRAYALCPDLVNDPRQAPWSVDLHETPHGLSMELRPRISPDPRMAFRTDDVDAASHPPLAACMARMAGPLTDNVIWDPFCGSGLELIECARRGATAHLYGTDASPDAIAIAQANLVASAIQAPASFTCTDFRAYHQVPGLAPGQVDLVITNPPMGRRIRLPDPKAFFTDFFRAVSAVLKPGGRLIFPNPLRLEPADLSLKLESRRTIDLGGFDCRLEVWRKTEAPPAAPPLPPPPPKPARKPARASEPWYKPVAKGRTRHGKFPPPLR